MGQREPRFIERLPKSGRGERARQSVMADRVQCCAPGCNRTTKGGKFTEWICAAHWKLVPRQMRRAKFRLDRQYRRLGFYPVPEVYGRIWRRIKREVGA